MQVRLLTDQDKSKWNDFVRAQPGSQILQTWEWGKFKAMAGWEHFILVVEEGSLIRAGMSVLARKLPLFNSSIFYSPRGPILSHADPKVLDALVDGICVEAVKMNAIALKIDPEVEETNYEAIDLLKAKGFMKKKKQVQPRSTYLIDLTKPLEDLLMSFEEKTRYNIRLAEKKGVQVHEDSSEAGIDIFYEQYKETCKRDKFLIHPRSYYTKLKELLIDNGMANVFIAEYEGKPIASLFVFRFGERIWYMYGASTSEYRNHMPNHALHWHLIRWAKEKGYKTYDMWGVPVNPKAGHPLFGVWRFKKGFNGQLVNWIGVYDLPFDKLKYNLIDKGINFYQAARSLLTKGKISDSLSE